MTYKPQPEDTSDVILSEEIIKLREKLAKNAHEIWAEQRIKDDWKFGKERDDVKKEHPCLVPYEKLPESEKEFDRNATMQTLKLIIKLGYEINKKID